MTKSKTSNYTSESWQKHIKKMLDREPNRYQLDCPHNFMKVPQSGSFMGHLVWRCITCDKFVEAS